MEPKAITITRFDLVAFFIAFAGVALPTIFTRLSIDDEQSLFRSDASIWVSQGRWGAYFVETLLVPWPTIPILPHSMMALAFFGFYVLYLGSLDDVARSNKLVLFAVFVANPIWWLIMEFDANVAPSAAGLFLATLASVSFLRGIRVNSWIARLGSLSLATLALTLSISMYQSFGLFFLTMVMAALLLQAKNRNGYRPTSILLFLGATSAASIGIYLLVDRALIGFLGLQRSTYITEQVDTAGLIADPLARVEDLFRFAFQVMSGSSGMFGVSLAFSSILFVLITIIISVSTKTALPVFGLIVVAILIFAPLLLAPNGSVPIRSLVALSVIPVLALAFALKSRSARIELAACLVAGVVIFQFATAQSSYTAAAQVSKSFDESVGHDLGRAYRLCSVEQGGSVEVAILGRLNLKNPYPTAWSSAAGTSMFDWDGGNPHRVQKFVRGLGWEFGSVQAAPNLTAAETGKIRAFPQTPFSTCSDGFFVIKLSE